MPDLGGPAGEPLDVQELVTTLVDVAGLVSVAAGLGMAAGWWWLPLGPLVGGLTLLGGVRLAEWIGSLPPRRSGGDGQ